MTIEHTAIAPRSVVNIKRLQSASRRLMVIPLDPERDTFVVESATHPGATYEVTLVDSLTGRCTCPWGQHGGVNCKHVLAALRARYAPQGALSFWPSRSDARRQHRQIVEGRWLYGTLRKRCRR